MSDLIASERFAPELLDGALAAEFTLGPDQPSCAEQVFYDTFDCLVRASGAALRHQHGLLELIQREDGQAHAGADAAAAAPPPLRLAEPSTPLLGSQLPAGPLRDALLELIDVRALLALARLRVVTHARRVLDGRQKTVVRVGVQSPAVLTTSGREIALRRRVRLEGVRGYDGELLRVRELILSGLGLVAAAEPLVDEAVLALGGAPAGISSKVDVPLDPLERTDRGAVLVLQRLLEVMDANLPGTIADTDTEFLHDYRVAVRRTRSVQRELAAAFEPGPLAAMRTEFRWLQQITGDARDLDVYVLEFESMRALLPAPLRADLEPLLGVLERRRLVARREMIRALRSRRADTVRADWEAQLASLVTRPEAERPACSRPIGAVTSERIRKVYRQMVKMGDAIGPSSPPEDYHELRKKGKELRYLLEQFGVPLHDEFVVRPMIRALKGLQDVLGRHQDREIQMGTLRSLAAEVSALPGGAGALIAMGALIERLDRDMLAARGEFAESFAVFASPEQRLLVRETFA